MNLSLLSALGFAANTFTDKETGLMWQDDKHLRQGKWEMAIDYCQNLNFAGYHDWRLPTITELESIEDDRKSSSAVKSGLKNVADDYHWSSTSYVEDPSAAWSVRFGHGGDSTNNKSYDFFVRCVRDSKKTLKFDSFNEKLEQLFKLEIDKIPKPPQNVRLTKGEFETTQDFNERVTQETINKKQKVQEYEQTIADKKVKAYQTAIRNTLMCTWGKALLSNLKYDADNGYFVANLGFEVKKYFHKTVTIKVNKNDAQAFKAAFDSIQPQAVFEVTNGNLSLKNVQVSYNSTLYVTQFSDMKSDDTRVAVNIKNEFNVEPVTSPKIRVIMHN